MIHKAWRMPGTYPRIVSKMLSQNAPVNPTSRNTPNGGKIIAKMIFKMSMDFYSLVIVIERTITDLFMEAIKTYITHFYVQMLVNIEIRGCG